LFKIYTVFALALVAFFYAGSAFTQTFSTGPSTMDFGQVEVATGGGNSAIQLGTDGTIVYTNKFSGAGIGSPASAVISGTVSSIVDIGCEKTGTLAEPTGDTISLKNTGITVGTANAAAFSGLTLCGGLNGPGKVVHSHTLTGNTAQDTVQVGAELTGAISVFDTYNTTNAGGANFIIRIVYQ
jgi:hypothetical protein